MSPILSNVSDFGLNVIFVTFTAGTSSGSFTSTSASAFTFDPSIAAAVIFAVPFAFAVTSPVCDTVATVSLFELHSIFLLSASSGCTLALIVFFVFNLLNVSVSGSKTILLTFTGSVTSESVTVTVTDFDTPEPSAAIAVIIAVPLLTAITAPLLDTAAISG